jgi:hypothetical protein
VNVVTFKKMFFDSEAVVKALDPKVRKALSAFGARVRRTDKNSLKYARPGQKAQPGKPPLAHRSTGFTRRKKVDGTVKQQPASPLRELTFFGWDASTKSIVIGPALGGPAKPDTLGELEDKFPHTGPAFRKELAKVGGDFRNLIR